MDACFVADQNDKMKFGCLGEDIVGGPIEFARDSFDFHHYGVAAFPDEIYIHAFLVAEGEASLGTQSVKDREHVEFGCQIGVVAFFTHELPPCRILEYTDAIIGAGHDCRTTPLK